VQENTKGTFLSMQAPCSSRPDLSHYYGHLNKAKKIILKELSKAHLKKAVEVFGQCGGENSNLITRPLKFAVYQLIFKSEEMSETEKVGMIEGERAKRASLEEDIRATTKLPFYILLFHSIRNAQDCSTPTT